MEKRIAYCGLNCETCDAYIATVNDDQALREKTAKLWAELNDAPITPEMITCDGCRVDGRKTPYCESLCEIRKCAMAKGHATCGLCETHSTCASLRPVLESSPDVMEHLQSDEAKQ